MNVIITLPRTIKRVARYKDTIIKADGSIKALKSKTAPKNLKEHYLSLINSATKNIDLANIQVRGITITMPISQKIPYSFSLADTILMAIRIKFFSPRVALPPVTVHQTDVNKIMVLVNYVCRAN